MKLYKIIQLLRLSRLVLLVILLLFAVAAKIARAETADLYKVSAIRIGQGEIKGFASPEAACAATDQPQFVLSSTGAGDYGYCRTDNNQPSWLWYNVNTYKYTCDAKELTHNGVSDGVESPSWLHWMRAPSGIDAADWYSDRFKSCENNCIVVNQRVPFSSQENRSKKSITETDGTSRSAFLKTQTGSVCVVEKQKPDVIPKPPAPDNGDSTDGQSDSSPGSDSGNGTGSNGQSGSGSEGDGNQSSNQGSGNSDEGSSSSGGSSGGSGGVNGSGGQTGPSGGGTSGGESGGDQAEGSEGSTEGGESGDGQSGGGSGNEGGQGGADGSGEGVDGDDEAGGHYFPCPSGRGSYKKGTKMKPECSGEGEGDGDGSIGGGSCDTDTPPDCKGDPIQCYIAREQWRTACAASGKSNKVEGDGNCGTQTPPECKGDATQCYIVKQQFLEGCARQSLEAYGREQASKAQSYLEGDGFDNIGKDLEENDTTVKLPNQLNTSGYGFTRSCPTLQFDINVALFGSFKLDFSVLCGLANLLGNLFVAISLVLSARYILR